MLAMAGDQRMELFDATDLFPIHRQDYIAGLRPFYRKEDGRVILGDELVAVSGSPVASTDELLNILENHQAGDKVTVTLIRASQRIERTILLGLPGD